MNLIEKAKAAVNNTDWTNLFAPRVASEASWQTIVSNVLEVILAISGALAVGYLIYSGILYITAAGNPDAAKKGQQGIINAVIGIVIIVAAYYIVRVAMGLGDNITGTGI